MQDVPDEALLMAGDGRSFETFYLRHVDAALSYFARRVRDPEVAADLTAETFAAALEGQRRFRPDRGSALAWFYGIAGHQYAQWRRRGAVAERARRRLAMERIALTPTDADRIAALADELTVVALIEELPADQRSAVRARVLEDRGYSAIADDAGTSEASVRKRVSRGLAALRERIGDGR